MDLTQDFLRETFSYHEGSLYWKQYKKGLRNKCALGYRAGHLGKLGYRQVEVDGVAHPEHRMVWIFFNGECDKTIDHINGVKNDNRIENLRPATKAQNAWNVRTSRANKSGTKGVCFRKDRNAWVATISYCGRSIYLGYFKTRELADEFVDLARGMIHGNFAKT
jgi:hypothetical protein